MYVQLLVSENRITIKLILFILNKIVFKIRMDLMQVIFYNVLII